MSQEMVAAISIAVTVASSTWWLATRMSDIRERLARIESRMDNVSDRIRELLEM